MSMMHVAAGRDGRKKTQMAQKERKTFFAPFVSFCGDALRRCVLAAVCILALMCAAQVSAQTASDPGEGLRAAVGSTAGTTAISWWGKAGRSYFVQTCETLMEADWRYVPVIETGTDAVVTWNLSSSGQRGFVRLVYTDQTFSGPVGEADFDLDGLSNATEIALDLRTDPFKSDTDGDFLNDLIETQLGTNATNGDSDGDGYVDGAEVAGGSDANNAQLNPVLNGAMESGKSEFPALLHYLIRSVSNEWSQSRYPGGAITNGSMSWWDDVPSYGSIPPYHTFAGRWAEGLGHTSYPLTDPARWTVTYGTTNTRSELYINIDPDPLGYDVGRASLHHRAYTMRSQPAGSNQPWMVTRRFLAYERNVTKPQTGSGETTISNVRMESFTIMPGAAQASRILYSAPTVLDREVNTEHLGPVTIAVPNAQFAYDNWSERHWIMLPKDQPQTVIFWQNNFENPPAYQASGGGVAPSRVVWHSESSIDFTSDVVGDAGYLRFGIAKDEQSTPVFAPADFLNSRLSFTVKPKRQLSIGLRPITYISPTGASVPPPDIPDPVELQSYLNSIYERQANIHCTVTLLEAKAVVYDVGLGAIVTQPTAMAGDGLFEVFHGQWNKVDIQSAEVQAILNAAPRDTSVRINIYYVAVPNGMWGSVFRNAADEEAGQVGAFENNGQDGGLQWASVNGIARRNLASAFVRARELSLGNNSVQHTIAHEIGHLLGLNHTIGDPASAGPGQGFLPNADNELRLMSGLYGLKKATNPQRMNKAEWDVIHLSPLLINPN